DLTVTREADDRFMIVTAAATQVRDFHWLKDHIGPNDRAIAVDVTSGTAVFSVMGPNSRTFLQALTPSDLSNEAFPFGTSQEMDLGYARVRASRVTYVGELGWEIYVPAEFAAAVFGVLSDGGSNGAPRLAGYHALNSLRMEKGYRHWGHDITPDDSPLEAGLGFAVAWNKPDGFIGKEALARQRGTGLTRRLVQLALVDSNKLLYHNEPIWRDGSLVGETSSGMWGHTLQQSLAMGYVANPDGVADAAYINAGAYEVEVAGVRLPARVSLQPFYDPKSLRVKA
ncbi:MAG: aminomethyltransferase family protein, partial [Ilumatobacteraceae bacterium]|nr:aminomethyltransferase family protein [Ilumatobacteraceae bacterium]